MNGITLSQNTLGAFTEDANLLSTNAHPYVKDEGRAFQSLINQKLSYKEDYKSFSYKAIGDKNAKENAKENAKVRSEELRSEGKSSIQNNASGYKEEKTVVDKTTSKEADSSRQNDIDKDKINSLTKDVKEAGKDSDKKVEKKANSEDDDNKVADKASYSKAEVEVLDKDIKDIANESIYGLFNLVVEKLSARLSSQKKLINNNKDSKLLETIERSENILKGLTKLKEKGFGISGDKELKALYDLLSPGKEELNKLSLNLKDVLLRIDSLINNKLSANKELPLKGKKMSSKWDIKRIANAKQDSISGNNNAKEALLPSLDEAKDKDSTVKEARLKEDYSFRDIKEQPGSNLSVKNRFKLSSTQSFSSTIDAENILSQVIKKATASISASRSEVKIQLEPRMFGNVTLNILMDNGVVSGSLNVDSSFVKKVLEENLLSLKESLEEQGFKMDNIDISYKRDEHAMSDERDRFHTDRNIHNIEDSHEEQDAIMDRYISPSWMAREVNLVV